jgi:hypothetical protein
MNNNNIVAKLPRKKKPKPTAKFDLPEGIIIEYKRRRGGAQLEEISPLLENFIVCKKTWHRGAPYGVVIALPLANDYYAFGWHALHPDDAELGIEFDRYFSLAEAIKRAQAGTPLELVPFPLRSTLLNLSSRCDVDFAGRKLIDIQAEALESVEQ